MTRSFRFESHGTPGEPLGVWGYGVRALALLGFVGGGLAGPILLKAKPYCEACRSYKRTTEVARIPAAAPRKKSKPAEDILGPSPLEKAQAGVAAIFGAAKKGDASAIA